MIKHACYLLKDAAAQDELAAELPQKLIENLPNHLFYTVSTTNLKVSYKNSKLILSSLYHPR